MCRLIDLESLPTAYLADGQIARRELVSHHEVQVAKERAAIRFTFPLTAQPRRRDQAPAALVEG
jgi:hypothetical protein